MNFAKSILAAAIAAALVACGGASEQKGTLRIGVNASALSGVSATGSLTITGPNGYGKSFVGKPLPLIIDEEPVWVGNYHYVANGTGTGGAKFSAMGDFTVLAGKITDLKIIMQQDNATPMAVIAPYTTQLQFTLPGEGSGAWGEALDITALVTHPDNDRPDMDYFVYEWKHHCEGTETKPGYFWLPGEIDFFVDGWSKPTARIHTRFTSFCQGVETVTLVSMNTNDLFCIDKDTCRLISTVSVDIPYDPQGYAGKLTANFAPSVNCSLVNNAEPRPGEQVTVKATASDPDGDALAFEWKDSCGGAFSNAAALDTVWTAPAGYCQACTLTLTVTDARGGKNTGTIGVKTAPKDLAVGCVAQ